jgi:hypothetical protein
LFKTLPREGSRLARMNNPILAFLPADGPHPDLGAEADLYGRFVGSWDIDNHYYDEKRGQWADNHGECHFGWIHDGRAIQDLWGSPERGFGTTIRSYDLSIDAWRIHWFSPAWASFCRLIGRAEGDRIVQLGEQSDGRPIRWSFNDITADSFLWRGETSEDDGVTWRLEQQMHARRRT